MKGYVRNTINLSCAKIFLTSVIEAGVMNLASIFVTVLTEVSHIAASFLLLGRGKTLLCSAKNYRGLYTQNNAFAVYKFCIHATEQRKRGRVTSDAFVFVATV